MRTWLEEDSPEYWRRAWLWVMRADLGDVAELLQGPSRDWAIGWLASGYPVDQLAYILSRAEEEALRIFDLPKLIRLRCLKTRALNAREYQSPEWGSFRETSLVLSRDRHLGAVLWDKLARTRNGRASRRRRLRSRSPRRRGGTGDRRTEPLASGYYPSFVPDRFVAVDQLLWVHQPELQ